MKPDLYHPLSTFVTIYKCKLIIQATIRTINIVSWRPDKKKLIIVVYVIMLHFRVDSFK